MREWERGNGETSSSRVVKKKNNKINLVPSPLMLNRVIPTMSESVPAPPAPQGMAASAGTRESELSGNNSSRGRSQKKSIKKK